MKLLMNEKGSKNWSLFSSYPNIVPIVFFTSSHSQLGCNKFSSWVTTHTVPKKGLGTPSYMDKTGRKTGNQWATKAGNDKEDTYAMACILLKSIGAPGRNRTHGPQLRRLLLYPTELLAQIKSVERVTGIEPASPAWKAGALTIVLHLHCPPSKSSAW